MVATGAQQVRVVAARTHEGACMLASVQGTVHGRLGLVSKFDCGSDATEAVMAQNRGETIERQPQRKQGEVRAGRVWGRGWSQSHEGDVSTCHVVVITCATVAARLVVITLVRRGGARDCGGWRECRSWTGDGEGRERKQYRLDYRLNMESALILAQGI